MLKRNLIANYLGQIWTALMRLAFIPLYIHYLGIESYALIGLFGFVMTSLSVLDMGMTPTLSREMANFMAGKHTSESIRDLLRSIEIITFGISALIIVIFVVSSHWLASSWLQTNQLSLEVVSQALTIMGVVAALNFATTIYRSSISGLQRQVLLNVVNTVLVTLQGLGAVAILAWVSPTIQAFFVWQGVIALTTLLTLALTLYKILPRPKRLGRFSLEVLREVWRFAGGMMGITLLALLLTQVDKILLSRLLSLTDYGYYTLATTVAAALTALACPIAQAWFPRLTELVASENYYTLVKVYHEGAQLVTVIVGSAALVLVFFGDIFLQLWTQNPELSQKTAFLLSLLVLGNLLHSLMWIPYYTQLAYGWTSLSIQVNVFAISFIIPAILWTTPRYGAVGAAWCWIVLCTGYISLGAYFMYRRILKSEKARWYKRDIIYPLLPAIAVAIVIRILLPPLPNNWFFQIITLILISLSILFTSLLAADNVKKRLSIFLF